MADLTPIPGCYRNLGSRIPMFPSLPQGYRLMTCPANRRAHFNEVRGTGCLYVGKSMAIGRSQRTPSSTGTGTFSPTPARPEDQTKARSSSGPYPRGSRRAETIPPETSWLLTISRCAEVAQAMTTHPKSSTNSRSETTVAWRVPFLIQFVKFSDLPLNT